ERIDCLVDGFFGCEQQPALKRIVAELQPLLRSGDQIHQLRRQTLRRLDVDAHCPYVARFSDCSDRYASIVGEGADYTGRPDWRPRGRPRYRAFGISEAGQKLAGGDASGTAGPPDFYDASGACGCLLP